MTIRVFRNIPVVVGRASFSSDPFVRLGVNRNAALNEIKIAYHRQALAFHPDTSQYKDASRRFKALQRTYDNCLSQRQQPGCRQHRHKPRPPSRYRADPPFEWMAKPGALVNSATKMKIRVAAIAGVILLSVVEYFSEQEKKSSPRNI